MNNSELAEIFEIILIVAIFILFILVLVYLFLLWKSKAKEKAENDVTGSKADKKAKKKTYVEQNYTKLSIFDFMEFNKVSDNMIIQQDGKRYLMVIECQGVNYDLMSALEKNGVEQGFLEFLNSLRRPIQIYVQTRTINLDKSIQTYKSKMEEVSDKLTRMQAQYDMMVQSGEYSEKQLQAAYFEVTKQRNLFEYGNDVIFNTEKLSKNQNILNKKYYIIISHFPEEATDSKYAKDEVANIAFSELYTEAQSLISTLSGCSVNGKILNSVQLADLLYEAYNRDESNVFGIEKALEGAYDELYVTAPDVLDKRMKILDQEAERKAFEKANSAIEKVKTEKQRQVEERERKMNDIVDQMAKILLEQNRRTVGADIADEAIEMIDSEKKEEISDVQEEKSKRRRTTRKKTK